MGDGTDDVVFWLSARVPPRATANNARRVPRIDEEKKCLQAGRRRAACMRAGWRQQGPGAAVVFAVGLKGRVFDNDDYGDGRRDCDFQVRLPLVKRRRRRHRRRFHGCLQLVVLARRRRANFFPVSVRRLRTIVRYIIMLCTEDTAAALRCPALYAFFSRTHTVRRKSCCSVININFIGLFVGRVVQHYFRTVFPTARVCK